MASIVLNTTSIPGLIMIKSEIYQDTRGTFTKVYNERELKEHGLSIDFKESYYSYSKKGVIRGMHFQLPPHDHAKLVYVSQGKIRDCILDIRINSPTYGKHIFTELSQENGVALYISSGLAHGFEAIEDGSCVTYLQTSMHNSEVDFGIHFASFGANWESQNPVISERDSRFVEFSAYQSEFYFKE